MIRKIFSSEYPRAQTFSEHK